MEMSKRLEKKKSKNIKNSDCLKLSIAIMKYSGVWMPDGVKQPWKYTYVVFGLTLQTFVFFLVIVAEVAYVFKVSGDTERTIEAAVLLLSHIVQGVKMCTIWGRQGRIKELIRNIDGPNFHKPEPNKRVMIEDTVRLVVQAGRVISVSVAITALFWAIVPILKSELTLPLKTVYPFDISGSIMFGIMYAYSAVSVFLVGLDDWAENYMVSALLILAGAQLDVLCAELREIGNQGNAHSYEETVKCIEYHQNIIEYVNEIGSIFGLPIFCQFIASSAVICMTLFKVTITKEPMELMTVSFYLILVFMELLMYCYPGDLILNKSLLVAEAACSNKWSGDMRSRKALLLCTIRAQRPLIVNAGGVFRASLPTSAAVVRTAYSYYAVLQQMVNK